MIFERAYLQGISRINHAFPEEGERGLRIAILRVHRAAGNAQLRLDAVDGALVEYLRELDPICASKLKAVALDAAERLESLAAELRKSVPKIRDIDELAPETPTAAAPEPPITEPAVLDDCPF